MPKTHIGTPLIRTIRNWSKTLQELVAKESGNPAVTNSNTISSTSYDGKPVAIIPNFYIIIMQAFSADHLCC